MKNTEIYAKIVEKSNYRKNKIAVGLLHAYEETIESLRRIKDEVEITLVGPSCEIHKPNVVALGLNSIEGDAKRLVQLVKEENADAVFRGNFDAVSLYDAITEVCSHTTPIHFICPIVLNKINSIAGAGSHFISFLPISPSNDTGIEGKEESICYNIRFFQKIGIENPCVGVLSGGIRKCDSTDKTRKESELLLEWGQKNSYRIKHFDHKVEYAVQESEIVVYPDSITGNQAMRAMNFFGNTVTLPTISANLPILYAHSPDSFREWDILIRFLNGYLNF